jgi:3-oxoacyl-[acyl-carrier protein] reductase
MLKGKVAIITGAARGIGHTVARRFAENGAGIAVVDVGVTEGAAAEISEKYGVKAAAYTCDVSDFEASKAVCGRILADFGGADILVNNAGITRDNLLLRMSEADFDAVLAVNLKGAFNFTKHLTRALLRSPGGRIINISSVVGLAGNAGQANYSASKAGLIGLTKSAAKELAGKGVTCNAVAPGFIETHMTASLSQAVLDGYRAAIPMKRMGNMDDIANAALFLASDWASYITGEVVRVDGGMCM